MINLLLSVFFNQSAIAQNFPPLHQPEFTNIGFYPREDHFSFSDQNIPIALDVRSNDIINEFGFPIVPVISAQSSGINAFSQNGMININIDKNMLSCGENRFYIKYYLAIQTMITNRSLNEAVATIDIIKKC